MVLLPWQLLHLLLSLSVLYKHLHALWFVCFFYFTFSLQISTLPIRALPQAPDFPKKPPRHHSFSYKESLLKLRLWYFSETFLETLFEGSNQLINHLILACCFTAVLSGALCDSSKGFRLSSAPYYPNVHLIVCVDQRRAEWRPKTQAHGLFTLAPTLCH